MRWDGDTMSAIAAQGGPVFRLFRFSEPTVTYGRFQPLDQVRALAPSGWPLVRRPTAGGLVFHQNDLCFSLCWPPQTPPLPSGPRDVYRWIHSLVLESLHGAEGLRLAACCDGAPPSIPSGERQCFRDPVGYDIMQGEKKIVGGALAVKKEAILYQGSIQNAAFAQTGRDLRAVFERTLLACV